MVAAEVQRRSAAVEAGHPDRQPTGLAPAIAVRRPRTCKPTQLRESIRAALIGDERGEDES
jgi:hypothetical protein